ncbi:MAG: UbiD family decarboxylase [Deltaproteobacteria bacterium]|nr:UbiD family decarboxylase [Deltaproteobacteria bacterium]
MAYRDIREFLKELEARGRLRRVKRPVDAAWEVAALARWLFQAVPERDRFGLYFEEVKGSRIPVMTGVLGASRETYALALGTEPERINDAWVKALLEPRPSVRVGSAPCQEVVLQGAEVDLGTLPIPVWTPGKDAAPYLTTLTLSRDAETGIQNAATYRAMVLDAAHLAVNLPPGRHGALCLESYRRRGEPAPFAWVIGAEPAVHLAAVANVPYGVDELTIAGGLKGEPVDVVWAKTQDLYVPANAEIVIEGEIRPGEEADEGPFGEFAGFMGPVGRRPRVTVTAITSRRDPIYYGYLSQMPPSESTVIQGLGNAGLLLKLLRHDLGHRTVADVAIDTTYGGLLGHGTVALRPLYPGHARQVGRLVADVSLLKRVTVVDADIDIRDPIHVAWAMNAHFQPQRDTLVLEDTFTPANMDPSVRSGEGRGTGSKLVIDATQKEEAGSLSLPSRELMERALDVWREAGLPEFELPKRVQLLLDRA